MTAIEQMAEQATQPHLNKRFFDALCIEFGGMGKAAEALGITYTAIHNWSFRGVPLSRVKQIEELSEGRVHRGLL